MKLTAEYKDGVLVPDRPISPKNSIVHLQIDDNDLAPSDTESAEMAAFLDEEERKIKELMARDPFYANLWRGMPTRPARPHGKSDKQLLEEAIASDPKYFPQD